MTLPVIRATVLFDAGDAASAALYRDWLARMRAQLTFVSEDEGCGCCVHLFDIEGSAEAMASIPEQLRCESNWSRPELAVRLASLRDANSRADVHRDAARAFHEQRYHDVLRALAPIEQELSDAQRAKLEYARRQQSRLPASLPAPVRTWWNRWIRRRR